LADILITQISAHCSFDRLERNTDQYLLLCIWTCLKFKNTPKMFNNVLFII